MGPTRTAARALEPLQRPRASRRARARLPDQQLDRARRVAIHRARSDRSPVHLLRAPPAGRTPARPARAGDAADAAARGRDGRRDLGAISHRRRRELHLPGRIHRSQRRRDRAGNGQRDTYRARRHAHGRPDLRGVDGAAQERGLLLMSLLGELERRPLGSDRGVLRFVTAGSVDDGKSTLIGRLLYDPRASLEDQLAAVERAAVRRGVGEIDLSLLTDRLGAEREQRLTIDVPYRYFATPRRKFIIADAPGHEQYTRNMATGASTAEAAVVLIEAAQCLLPQSLNHISIAAPRGHHALLP